MNEAYLKSGRTKESDECLTPRYVVYPIIKYLKAKGFKKIWCPFDLEYSLYVKILKSAGFSVINSHIDVGGDFFSMNYSEIEFDCIVSNPPYTSKDKILKRLYEIGKPFAVLLPITSLQSEKRTPLFREYGLELLTFTQRACFYTNNDLEKIRFGNHFASGYFCKDVLPSLLIFENLEPIQEPYYGKDNLSTTSLRADKKVRNNYG